jgi:hypothetical protein
VAARLPRLSSLLLAAACAGTELAAQTDTAHVHSVTGETLRRAGASRSSDVLPLVTPWPLSTVDGFTWQASPPSGGSFTPARTLVLVDGRRVEADFFGRLDLDRLGIPLDRIARVDFVELPRLVAGRITTQGAVHIHTIRPEPGTAAHAWYASGTEIGDPGPFAFIPPGGENVDRLGHDAAVSAAHASDSWFASAALASSVRNPTDPAILARYRAALGPVPRLESTAFSLDAGARAGTSRHRFSLRHARPDGVLWLNPLGAEVGIRERVTEVGLAGTTPVGSERELSWDLAHTAGRISPRGVEDRPAVEWETGMTEGRLELIQRQGRLSIAGVRLRRLTGQGAGPLSHQTISLATAYAELTLGRDRARSPRLAAALTGGDGEAGLAAVASRAWTLAGGSTLETVVAYERAVRAEDTDIWAWTERGYRLFEDAGADVEIVGERRGAERISGDACWSLPVGRTVRLVGRGFYRRDRRLALERARLHFVPGGESFEGPVALVHGAGGELAGGSVELELSAVRTLMVRGSWWYAAPVGGDTLYRETRAAVPRHVVQLTSEWVPVSGLELWLSARWRSASRWAAFETVEAETGGRYRSEVDPALVLDLAIAKHLWDGRFGVQAAVRNLLGGGLTYHPAGATFAPTAVVRLEARLP